MTGMQERVALAMREISRSRWNALASYCKNPAAAFLLNELAWFESDDGRALATLVIDADREFHGLILARDGADRFRAMAIAGPFESPRLAVIGLNSKLLELLPNLDELRIQGDEVGEVIDLFAPLVPDWKLHPSFRRLASGDDFSAAREIIGSMMRWYEDTDGNFVEQFQTKGFDARLWELYLFAALTEAGLHVSRPNPAPDMLVRGVRSEFALEATTINPSRSPDGLPLTPPIPRNDNDIEAYVQHYLPIRYAGPLTAKLAKEYWNRPAAVGKPLVLAIQDFHAPLSMSYSFPALPIYLYGLIHQPRRDGFGRLIVEAVPITEHRWGNKVVQSGFFHLLETENISAVIFNNAGTLHKFNRMGVGAGFGTDNITLVRRGTAWDPDPDSSVPIPFEYEVTENSPETWVEGMDVFHNPNALHPLDPDLLPGAAHHRLLPNKQIVTTSRGWKPMESCTEILQCPRASHP
ncbi:hypothetical protein ACGFIU_18750 [Rhodococcus oryzae]|uniref:hypothetical protein n=1 Tax=Rhodococcus oryzae TaxID=2571143 RepID=UPI00371BB1A3